MNCRLKWLLRKLKAAVPTSTWLKRAINTSFERRELYVSADGSFKLLFLLQRPGASCKPWPDSPSIPTLADIIERHTTCPRNCRNWKTLTRGVFTQPKCCYSAKIKSIRAFKVNELHHSSSRPLHNVSLPVLSRFSFIFFMYPIVMQFSHILLVGLLHKSFLIKDVLAFMARQTRRVFAR